MDITIVIVLSAVMSFAMYFLASRLSNGGQQTGYYYVRKLEDENEALRRRIKELESKVISLQEEIADLRREHIRVLRQLSQYVNTRERSGCDVRVVAVWPDATGLDLESEQKALFDSGVDVIPVFGVASRSSIVNAVATSKPDVLQISAHGRGESLEGGYTASEIDVGGGITSGWLISLLRESTVRLLVLMNCSSVEIARSVYNDGVVEAVVATTRDISDDDAVAFVSEFYRLLCKGETVSSAYIRSRLVLPSKNYHSIIMVGDGDFTLR